MLRSIFIICLLALFTGCRQSDDESFTRYHEDGRAKPVVVIVPIIDSTNYDIPWDLSEELTNTIVSRISQKKTLYVPSQEEFQIHFHASENVFGTDLSWTKKTFSPNEFVVFLELIEHANVPVLNNGNEQAHASSNLNMAVRVRVVDIRGETPKIVLQELIHDSYYISKNLIPTDYNHVFYGMDEYTTSPLGMAHTSLAKEIVERLSEYIVLAKSR